MCHDKILSYDELSRDLTCECTTDSQTIVGVNGRMVHYDTKRQLPYAALKDDNEIVTDWSQQLEPGCESAVTPDCGLNGTPVFSYDEDENYQGVTCNCKGKERLGVGSGYLDVFECFNVPFACFDAAKKWDENTYYDDNCTPAHRLELGNPPGTWRVDGIRCAHDGKCFKDVDCGQHGYTKFFELNSDNGIYEGSECTCYTGWSTSDSKQPCNSESVISDGGNGWGNLW